MFFLNAFYPLANWKETPSKFHSVLRDFEIWGKFSPDLFTISQPNSFLSKNFFSFLVV